MAVIKIVYDRLIELIMVENDKQVNLETIDQVGLLTAVLRRVERWLRNATWFWFDFLLKLTCSLDYLSSFVCCWVQYAGNVRSICAIYESAERSK